MAARVIPAHPSQLPNLVAAPGRPPAAGIGLGAIHKYDVVVRLGERHEDVVAQARIQREPVVDLEVILHVEGKGPVAQLDFAGETAFGRIRQSQQKTGEGTAVQAEIGIVGVRRGGRPLAEVEGTAAEIAVDGVLEGVAAPGRRS